ncbi:hypothetical protein [Sandaracinus amylolyticus]|uniref:Branched-chain amino acid ABC transporter, amino acid-binding protein n=1 Tax=Sandaracinus amylolyticus TaxID=927083 RepID=A0A0F6YH83_9BACT|nr:hypothetical protein [Sandaracinus amylolyticus]AKF04747.1 Branched-chain amino acid ABC transporter, amino acid-binding protein [Sandaracinus amylolyticus]
MRSSTIAVVVVALALGCAPDDATRAGPNVVTIGAVIDQTGSNARPQWRDAAELAIAHANRGLELAGGHRDLRFELRFSDSSGVPRVAMDRALAMTRDHAVAGLITDTTEDVLAIAGTQYDPEVDDVGVPIVCMACTSPELGDPIAADPDFVRQQAMRDRDHWVWRTAADSDPEAVALLHAARALGDRGDTNGDGVWKVAFYVVDDEFGNGFFEGIQRARDRSYPLIDPTGDFIRGGLRLEIVRHAPDIDANTHRWDADLAALTDDRNEEPEVNPGVSRPGEPLPDFVIDGEPDAIVEITFPLFAASITRAYVQAGDEVRAMPFLHHHNWRHETTLVRLVGFDTDGQEGVSHAVLDNCQTSGRTFAESMRDEVGHEAGIWDAQTYDAAMALMLATLIAIEETDPATNAQVEGTAVRDALARVSSGDAAATTIVAGPEGFAEAVRAIRDGTPIEYEGASGPVDFDAAGDVRNNFVHYRVEGARFVDQRTFGCVADPEGCAVVEGACGL